jgi:hypothetical protein
MRAATSPRSRSISAATRASAATLPRSSKVAGRALGSSGAGSARSGGPRRELEVLRRQQVGAGRRRRAGAERDHPSGHLPDRGLDEPHGEAAVVRLGYMMCTTPRNFDRSPEGVCLRVLRDPVLQDKRGDAEDSRAHRSATVSTSASDAPSFVCARRGWRLPVPASPPCGTSCCSTPCA